MPPPATTLELLNRIRKSGLVPPGDLLAFSTGVNSIDTIDPAEILDRLVRAHLLTKFQADRLAAGKYKGFVLGNYTILDRLGAGGMGQVFLAEHAAMRRFVALKVLPGNVYEEDIARERFLREARAAATLDHPNIVRVFDMNRDGKLLYFVMEYIEGITFQALVEKDGRRSIAAAASYAQQVALGLQHAHERGHVHRDIKPRNLLVDRAGIARLLDLGLVRSESDGDSKLTSQLGGARTILGTVDYLAPEQALDSSNVDIRADIYSLGATLYFLLAGHPIFPEGRAGQKLMWQQWRDPAPIESIRPDVPAPLGAIVHKALAKMREARFQTPRELAEALSPWVTGPVPPAGELIAAPPYRPFFSRSTPAPAPNRFIHLQGTEHSLPPPPQATPKPLSKINLTESGSGVVRLDDPREWTPAPAIAGHSANPVAGDDSARAPFAQMSASPPAQQVASHSTLILVALTSALAVALIFVTLAALLFALGVIKT